MTTLAGEALTVLLQRWSAGQRPAFDRLIARSHEELVRRAHRLMRGERRAHTLQTGALVNEAWLRLAALERVVWRDRRHFLAVASGVMRRVLVDHARAGGAIKRGGDAVHATLDEERVALPETVDLLELDDALGRLARHFPEEARVMELRYFGGCSVAETADCLGLSRATVKRRWAFARAWLYRELAGA